MTGVRVLVTGASGFVGNRLCPVLFGQGYDVRAMTRDPRAYRGVGTAVAGDVEDPSSLRDALEGCEVAYYLVHALDSEDFVEKDAAAAISFGEAAAEVGVKRIIYLGGLGDDRDDLSDHLRSRREVEDLLGRAGVPVTVLRAGIIVGHGGISWELTRQLVEHLPAMITPKWVATRCQPIGIDDVVRYLVGVIDGPEGVFEIGGPDVLTYREMMQHVAAIEQRRLPVVTVPLLTPGISARWLTFVTDVDSMTARNLVDSMSNEVVVKDDRIRTLVPFELQAYDDMVRQALNERGDAKGVPSKGKA